MGFTGDVAFLVQCTVSSERMDKYVLDGFI